VFSHREFLKSKGLGLPPIAELIELVREGGGDIEGNPLTVDAAVDIIDEYLKRKIGGL
jgi:hypothetical protein